MDFSFIPGFLPALQASPAAVEARARLSQTINGGRFSPRIRALVALVVAQESRCDYCIWAQSCIARGAGLSGEDLAFAFAGTALDRREAAIARLARVIARTGCFDPEEVRSLTRDPLLTPCDVVEIVANSALAVLDDYMIQGLKPDVTAANRRTA